MIVQGQLSESTNEHGDNFTGEDIREILRGQALNPKGLLERIANWIEKQKIKFSIIWQLIDLIHGNFTQLYLQENIGRSMTNLSYNQYNLTWQRISRVYESNPYALFRNLWQITKT